MTDWLAVGAQKRKSQKRKCWEHVSSMVVLGCRDWLPDTNTPPTRQSI